MAPWTYHLLMYVSECIKVMFITSLFPRGLLHCFRAGRGLGGHLVGSLFPFCLKTCGPSSRPAVWHNAHTAPASRCVCHHRPRQQEITVHFESGSDSSATPSVPSQPEGKIGLPRANPRGRLRSPSSAPRRDSAEPRPRGCSGLGEPRPALPSF